MVRLSGVGWGIIVLASPFFLGPLAPIWSRDIQSILNTPARMDNRIGVDCQDQFAIFLNKDGRVLVLMPTDALLEILHAYPVVPDLCIDRIVERLSPSLGIPC